MKTWLSYPVLLLACAAAQADLYRWVDADGKVQYSDQPPPANIKQVEQKKAGGGKASEAPMPYALQLAVRNFPVTLYSSACGPACTQAHALLAKRGIPYTELDATDPAVQEELKKNHRRGDRGTGAEGRPRHRARLRGRKMEHVARRGGLPADGVDSAAAADQARQAGCSTSPACSTRGAVARRSVAIALPKKKGIACAMPFVFHDPVRRMIVVRRGC